MTDGPLTIQLWQVGVLYHDYVRPGETFYRNTGAVHFTIVAHCNEGSDITNLFSEAVLPVASLVASAAMGFGVAVTTDFGRTPAADVFDAYEVVKTGVEAVCDFVEGGRKTEYFLEMSSAGWYAGYKHKLEIRGGNHQRFSIYDTKKKETYYL
jgi:hypothetical protein